MFGVRSATGPGATCWAIATIDVRGGATNGKFTMCKGRELSVIDGLQQQ